MTRIILASASPRRKKLLEQIGITCEVIPSDREEVSDQTMPQEIVQQLSFRKAEDIFEKLFPQGADERTEELTVVIGADTVVSLEGHVMGKPADEADACRMLSGLQGNTHQVYTGVTLFWKQGKTPCGYHTFFEKTDVSMYPMSREAIAAYIATGEPMDKAGAYGIQGKCAAYIRSICGDYNNVVGLPVGRLYQELKAGRLL